MVLPAVAPKLIAASKRLSDLHSKDSFKVGIPEISIVHQLTSIKRLETNENAIRPLALVTTVIVVNLIKTIKTALTAENLFSKLPINASQTLLENVYNPEHNESLSKFFSRLNSFDLRLQYIRWGDRATRQCTWCSPQSGIDFA